jgi:hypothetical protein
LLTNDQIQADLFPETSDRPIIKSNFLPCDIIIYIEAKRSPISSATLQYKEFLKIRTRKKSPHILDKRAQSVIKFLKMLHNGSIDSHP